MGLGIDAAEQSFRAQVRAHANELRTTEGEPAIRKVIGALGAEGLIEERWRRSDHLFGVALVEELACAGLASTAVGASLHAEAVIAVLRQFAKPGIAEQLRGALAGQSIGCMAASEFSGGSDLSSVQTIATPIPDGWHVNGEKKFVTLATEADMAVVLANTGSGSEATTRSVALLVPREGFEVVHTHRLVGANGLDTSWIRIDATVPHDHLLGASGLGLGVVTWGLTMERLAIASIVIGICRLSLALAVAHAHRRGQFGKPLIEHQALRLRLAALQAELEAIRLYARSLADSKMVSVRHAAGLKVTAARFGERCVSECMHIFGGDGYLSDSSPLGYLWRTVRLFRIGGGTDEMMWEIVARDLRPDFELYELLTSTNHPQPGSA